MTDDLSRYLASRPTPADRPLMGLTILVVEDSRYSSEALRLMALRSGARMRRADCLKAAYRHLQTYRPGVAIIDMGLPDGSGAELITHLCGMATGKPAIISLSGDADREAEARDAGADAFLAKPLESIAVFQHTVASVLPESSRPRGLRVVPEDVISPDPLALRDDLHEAARILTERPDAASVDYVGRFLSGVARATRDEDLVQAAEALRLGRLTHTAILHATGLVKERLAAGVVF